MKNGFVFASLIATVVLTSGGFADAAWVITKPTKGSVVSNHADIATSGTGPASSLGAVGFSEQLLNGVNVIRGSAGISTQGTSTKWSATLTHPRGGWPLSPISTKPNVGTGRVNNYFLQSGDTFVPSVDSIVKGFTVVP